MHARTHTRDHVQRATCGRRVRGCCAAPLRAREPARADPTSRARHLVRGRSGAGDGSAPTATTKANGRMAAPTTRGRAALGYCDGASFTGNKAEPVPTADGTHIYFRGAMIFDAALKSLASNQRMVSESVCGPHASVIFHAACMAWYPAPHGIHACESDAWRAVHAGTRRRGPTMRRRKRCARLDAAKRAACQVGQHRHAAARRRNCIPAALACLPCDTAGPSQRNRPVRLLGWRLGSVRALVP